MTQNDNLQHQVLPIPDQPHIGLTTYAEVRVNARRSPPFQGDRSATEITHLHLEVKHIAIWIASFPISTLFTWSIN